MRGAGGIWKVAISLARRRTATKFRRSTRFRPDRQEWVRQGGVLNLRLADVPGRGELAVELRPNETDAQLGISLAHRAKPRPATPQVRLRMLGSPQARPLIEVTPRERKSSCLLLSRCRTLNAHGDDAGRREGENDYQEVHLSSRKDRWRG